MLCSPVVQALIQERLTDQKAEIWLPPTIELATIVSLLTLRGPPSIYRFPSSSRQTIFALDLPERQGKAAIPNVAAIGAQNSPAAYLQEFLRSLSLPFSKSSEFRRYCVNRRLPCQSSKLTVKASLICIFNQSPTYRYVRTCSQKDHANREQV